MLLSREGRRIQSIKLKAALARRLSVDSMTSGCRKFWLARIEFRQDPLHVF
jgi:hypothetical protein